MGRVLGLTLDFCCVPRRRIRCFLYSESPCFLRRLGQLHVSIGYQVADVERPQNHNGNRDGNVHIEQHCVDWQGQRAPQHVVGKQRPQCCERENGELAEKLHACRLQANPHGGEEQRVHFPEIEDGQRSHDDVDNNAKGVHELDYVVVVRVRVERLARDLMERVVRNEEPLQPKNG